MGKLSGKDKGVDQIYQRISDVLADARGRAWQAVNTAMVSAYWEIGRIIVEEEQKGESRAEFGTYMLDVLSERLTADFGKGFDRTNVSKMGAFYLGYPIVDALRPQLTWTHYRLLMRVRRRRLRLWRKYMSVIVTAEYKTFLKEIKERNIPLE